MKRKVIFDKIYTNYLKYPKERGLHFEEYLSFFSFKEHPDTLKHRMFLSNLELKADYLLAFNEFIYGIEDLKTVNFNKFALLYRKEIRKDLNINRGLGHDLKRTLKKARFEYLRNTELERLRVIYGLSELNYLPVNEFQTQELNTMRRELEEYLISNWGKKKYKNFIAHYVYGEPYKIIAAKNKYSLARAAQILHKVRKDYCKWILNRL